MTEAGAETETDFDRTPESEEDLVGDRVGGAVGSGGSSSQSVTNNFDGTFDVEFTDRDTGVSYEGTYTETEDGYSVDVDFTSPSGTTGSLDVDISSTDATRTETFADGSTRTTRFDQNGELVSDRFETGAQIEQERRQREQEAEEEERRFFRESGDDKDGNGLDDLGDPSETKDPDDPNDTGGSGLP